MTGRMTALSRSVMSRLIWPGAAASSPARRGTPVNIRPVFHRIPYHRNFAEHLALLGFG